MANPVLVAVGLSFLGIFLVLLSWLGRLQSQLQLAASELDREREFHLRSSSELQKNLGTLEKHSRFLGRFIRDLPDLTREFHSRIEAGRMPGLLLRAVCRSLTPKQAVVLLCRRDASSNRRKRPRLIVAAVHPPILSSSPGPSLRAEEFWRTSPHRSWQ